MDIFFLEEMSTWFLTPQGHLLRRNNRGALLVVSFDFRHTLDNSTNVRKYFYQRAIR